MCTVCNAQWRLTHVLKTAKLKRNTQSLIWYDQQFPSSDSAQTLLAFIELQSQRKAYAPEKPGIGHLVELPSVISKEKSVLRNHTLYCKV